MSAFSHATLINAARQVARKSYSPYSRFPVGAAVLTADGSIFAGCNVENASYGLTVCAERTAIFKAVSEGSCNFKALAVVGGDDEGAIPCGACLQVMAEFCPPDFTVYLAPLKARERFRVVTLSQLLPETFIISGQKTARRGRLALSGCKHARKSDRANRPGEPSRNRQDKR